MEARVDQPQEESFLLRKGLNKELLDEMVPIGYFCSHFFLEDPEQVDVSLLLGNQTFDARVSDRRQSTSGIEYLEVACIEDQQEHRSRTEMLASGIGSIKRSSTDVFDLINAIIEKKAPKDYPKNTVLLMFNKLVYPEALYRDFEFEHAWKFRPLLDGTFLHAFIVDREKMIRL